MDKLRIFWMKVKKILILAICLCLVFVLVFHERSYTVTLEKNWQLDFSGKYKTIYAHEEDNNENIFGEGFIYHILEIDDAILDKAPWVDFESDNFKHEKQIEEVIKSLEIEDDNLLSSIEQYYYQEDGRDYLLLLLDIDEGKLYILENFE